jgi:hypothetical protein
MDFKSGEGSSSSRRAAPPRVIALGPGPSFEADESYELTASPPSLFARHPNKRSKRAALDSGGTTSSSPIAPGWTLVVNSRLPLIAEIKFQSTATFETLAAEDIPNFSSELSRALLEHRTLVHRSTSVQALSVLISNCASIAPSCRGKNSSLIILQAWRDIIQGKYAPASYVESYTNGAVRVSFKYSPHYPSRMQRLVGTIDRILGRCSRELRVPCFELTIERCLTNSRCTQDSSRVLAL